MKPKITDLERVAKLARKPILRFDDVDFKYDFTPQTALALIEALKTARGALQRLTKLGPPSKSCEGHEVFRVLAVDNCEIAAKALAALDEHFDWTES